jgi:hypothetical protein
MSLAISSVESGLKFVMTPDHHAPSPRDEECNLGVMVCSHRRYNLGDKDGFDQAVNVVREHFSATQLGNHDLSCPVEVYKLLQKSEAAIMLPLYLYDHSGLTISTSPFSCPWDSGQVGYIFVTKAHVRSEFGWKQLNAKRVAQIEASLRSEVATYDQYLTGDIWKFEAFKDDEVVESGYGFFGDDPARNGMIDSVPDEYVSLIKAGQFQRSFSI